MSECLYKDCKFTSHRHLDYCALHCDKETLDNTSALLEEFSEQLEDYIYEQVKNLLKSDRGAFSSRFRRGEYDPSIKDREVLFEGVQFPDITEHYSYPEYLKSVPKQRYAECTFHIKSFPNSNNNSQLFESCQFKALWQIRSAKTINNVHNARYINCIFDKNLILSETWNAGGKGHYSHLLFGCTINGTFIVTKLQEEKHTLFSYVKEKNHQNKIFCLRIADKNIKSNLTLSGSSIEKLQISVSNFNSVFLN